MELFMTKNKSLLAFFTAISLIAISTALPAQEIPDGAEESLLEARELCQGIGFSKHLLTKNVITLTILATISFASLIMLSILFLEMFKKRVTYKTFLMTGIFCVFILGVLLPFFESKILIYSTLGVENVERFKAISHIYNNPENWTSGLPSEMLEGFVYDLGWFFSVVIIFGLFGIPIALAPFFVLPAGASYFLIFFTKLSITNPICWLFIGQAMKYKMDNKVE